MKKLLRKVKVNLELFAITQFPDDEQFIAHLKSELHRLKFIHFVKEAQVQTVKEFY